LPYDLSESEHSISHHYREIMRIILGDMDTNEEKKNALTVLDENIHCVMEVLE